MVHAHVDRPYAVVASAVDETRAAICERLLAQMVSPSAPDDESLRHALLGSALRRWRSYLTPAEVGLPTRLRRRPGLTRADVAELAGISVAWYTLLEANAHHSVSPRAIDRIADALRLDDVERAILQTLASREAFRSLRILFATQTAAFPDRTHREWMSLAALSGLAEAVSAG